jgi:hypothetical protein
MSGRADYLQQQPIQLGALTEGAVRAIIRAAGDQFDGIILGRCQLLGDVTEPEEPIRVTVEASVLWGQNIPRLVGHVRDAITHALRTHTRLNITAVDITVQDLNLAPTSGDESR